MTQICRLWPKKKRKAQQQARQQATKLRKARQQATKLRKARQQAGKPYRPAASKWYLRSVVTKLLFRFTESFVFPEIISGKVQKFDPEITGL